MAVNNASNDRSRRSSQPLSQHDNRSNSHKNLTDA